MQVSWRLFLTLTNKNPVVLCCNPPVEPNWQGDNKTLLSFLFPLCSCSAQCSRPSFSLWPCQLKTCVSCYNTTSTGPMYLGNGRTYQHTQARKHLPTNTHRMLTYVHPPFLVYLSCGGPIGGHKKTTFLW